MAILFSDYIKEKIDSSKVLDATDWLREQSYSIDPKRIDTQNIIRKNSTVAENRVRLGHLYLFRYDPKLKQELPYYDTFPVIFIINIIKGGFMGLNMHYLPYEYRAKLMDMLYDYVTGEESMQRLKITYNVLSNTSKLRYYKPCLKHYLNNQVKSRFIHISPEEWEKALFLPLRRFKKALESEVHRDSVKQIRKSAQRGNVK